MVNHTFIDVQIQSFCVISVNETLQLVQWLVMDYTTKKTTGWGRSTVSTEICVKDQLKETGKYGKLKTWYQKVAFHPAVTIYVDNMLTLCVISKLENVLCLCVPCQNNCLTSGVCWSYSRRWMKVPASASCRNTSGTLWDIYVFVHFLNGTHQKTPLLHMSKSPADFLTGLFFVLLWN